MGYIYLNDIISVPYGICLGMVKYRNSAERNRSLQQ